MNVHKRDPRRLMKSRYKPIFILMLYTLAIILLVLWILGLVTSYTLGGWIHLLLLAAIVLVLIRLIRGENPTRR